MKTYFSFTTLLIALIGLCTFVACSPVETDVSTEAVAEIIVNDRFCYMPLNCLCDGIPSQVIDCNWGGSTEQMHTPRCSDKREYFDLINTHSMPSLTRRNNLYAVFFDENAICQPRPIRGTSQVICNKKCYTDRMWVFPYSGPHGVIEICSTDKFIEDSFQVLGLPQDSYTVTYESDDGVSCFYVDLFSPTQSFPTEWSGDMMNFRVDYEE